MSKFKQKRRKMGKAAGKGGPRQQQSRDWLLHLCISALAAGAVVAVGHWFSSRPQGRCIGGDKRRYSRAADNVEDEESGRDCRTSSKCTQPMSMAELRSQRLKAAEARLHPQRNGASAANLTPLGRILKLAERVDKLEEETQSLLGQVSVAKVTSPPEEKEQVRLLEELTLLQLEIDDVPGDESVRPHRKRQTNRIQTLVANLDRVEHRESLAGTVIAETGSSIT